MKPLLAACLILLPCHLTPTVTYAQQAEPLPAAPTASDSSFADYWAYVAVKMLQEGKIGIASADGTHSDQLRTGVRHDIAVAVASLFPALMSPSNPKYGPFHVRLQENRTAQKAFMSLLEEYRSELTALGQDVPNAEIRLAALRSISPPFPDVPKDHWAYQSVETLRKLGIVTGEADGRFHG